MHLPIQRLCDLFAQLGLPSEPAQVQAFIDQHRGLAGGLRLEDAPFWSAPQAQLLRELIAEDADGAELVDQLNQALHQRD